MEKMLGVMLDCSRNAVMKVDAVKDYALILKKMGYNTLMLYTEDTYEVDNQPYFGHLRGRYSKEEMKELDTYCNGIGIELVPCIQTLAHLENIFKWYTEYEDIRDCDDILLVGEDKTYALIEDMLSSLRQCYTTKKIHIGMDEAGNVGKGKYMNKHGLEDRFDIINNHLHKVCELCKKYDFEPMIWSDMFCNLALNIENQYEEVDASKILEKAALPENISLVYWDYYSTDVNRYKRQIKTNKMFGKPTYFAGGAWTWWGFAPHNQYSIDTTKAAITACNECGIDGVFFTVWGDFGGECTKYAVLPSLMYAAELVKGNEDMDSIKAKFKEIVGVDFDAFMLLDKLDEPGGNHRENPSRYLIFNDVFMGVCDSMCDIEDDIYYEKLAKDIKSVDAGEYSVIFDSYQKLAELLSLKASLGIRTREAYLAGDKATLKLLVSDYELAIEKLEAFHSVYQKLWFWENKPHGFDVQDIRLGGTIKRISSCKKRLEEFISGDVATIPELNEPVLEKINATCCSFMRTATVNNI